jgi:hypothetical protein
MLVQVPFGTPQKFEAFLEILSNLLRHWLIYSQVIIL